MGKTINSYEIKDNFVVLEVRNGKDDGTLEKEKIFVNKEVLKKLIKELTK